MFVLEVESKMWLLLSHNAYSSVIRILLLLNMHQDGLAKELADA